MLAKALSLSSPSKLVARFKANQRCSNLKDKQTSAKTTGTARKIIFKWLTKSWLVRCERTLCHRTQFRNRASYKNEINLAISERMR